MTWAVADAAEVIRICNIQLLRKLKYHRAQEVRFPKAVNTNSEKTPKCETAAPSVKMNCIGNRITHGASPHQKSLSFLSVPTIIFGTLITTFLETESLNIWIAQHLHKQLLKLVSLVLLLFAVSACASAANEEENFSQISDPGQVFTLDDLLQTTFKESSNYSTEGLPGSSDVSYGFLRIPGGDPYEYEVRFYKSHQEAVDLGTALAIEGSGETAILSKSDATYKEGVKNRRMACGSGVGGGARSGICSKFGSYAIFGNVVMLCQGADKTQSVERCGLLATELIANE
jgi:hypothetical protein